MKIFKLGLIGKIAILVGIVELMAFSLLGFLYSDKYTSTMEKNTRDRIYQINKMLANEEMPISSLAQISFMSNMIGEPYLEGIAIGGNRIIIVSSKPEYLGRKVDLIPGFKSQWLLVKPGEKFIIKENKLISIAYLNNDMSNKPLYQTVISINTKNLTFAKNKIIQLGILGSLLFILISTSLIIFIAQGFVANRINDSLKVLKKVEDGDFEAKITISQSDELGLLQKGINSMIQKVAQLLYEYKQSVKDVKAAQEKTLEQKEEFESIFKYSQDGIAIVDLKSNFLNCNDAFIDFIGYSKDELLQLNCDEIIGADYKGVNKEAFETVIKNGFIKNIEKECITKDGKHVNVLMSMSLLPDKNRVLISLRDMTAAKVLESQSKLASMGKMIGNIAHQWRQPLSVISVSASGLKLKADFGEEITKDEILEYADKVVENTNYLSRTIDDFRDFIKGDKKFASLSVKKSLEMALKLVAASLKDNFIKLEVDIKDDIQIYGSINELEQSFINIINNAKDALVANVEEGNRLIMIKAQKSDETILEIKICDNGGGIPPEVIDKIFEPYFTTKHQAQGTGLGLLMVDKIIRERHNQTIVVYNEEFEYNNEKFIGACFKITFVATRSS